jgi:glutamine synthetase
MALFAPNANSWRRFRPEAYVPLHAAWSINNRGTALRVPHSDAANRRLEHRIAGADANPYLVMAWVLAGVLQGLQAARLPPPAVEGNAYRQPGAQADASAEALPRHWPVAIERFAASDFAAQVFGPAFRQLYATVKQAELDDFAGHVTPRECALYLAPL